MIIDHLRDITEFKRLYDERPMPSPYDFDWLIKNPLLFCFYDDVSGELKGFITIQREGGLLTLSGVSVRKIMPDVIIAIIKVCDIFQEDMYAFTPKKEAGLVLKKAGFVKTGKYKYVRYQKNGKFKQFINTAVCANKF